MFAIGHNLDKTARGQAQAAQMQHNARGRTAGSRIHDLAALGKCILLTPDEAKKFNAASVGYATNPAIPRVNGRSDATGEWSSNLILFQKKG
jgi:hypothetical protein